MDKPCASQAQAVAFLQNPNAYDPPANNITTINTHAAIIFLAGDFAYKMKRAVRYSYLDFSTLEKRRRFCENEIKRNRTAAPGIYFDTIAIRRTKRGNLAFNKPGQPIEWLVRMRRFDQALLFSRMADQKTLTNGHMASLACTIARYHGRASRIPTFDFDANLAKIITTTVTSFAGASRLLGLDRVKGYANAIVREHNEAGEVLRSRTSNGFVRLCHGDLHLQNIVLFEGQPTLFDAIEFNDEIATIDVLFDLSFVLMDLWQRNLKSHANMLFNGYMSHPDTDEHLQGLSLFPLFLALRAAIRTMVTIDRLPFIDELSERTSALFQIKQYFRLACAWLRPEKPKLVAIGGRSGSGKTTMASAIANQIGRAPGAIHLRSDIERKRLFKVPVEHRLGPEAYTKKVSDIIYCAVCDKAARALRAGQSVVVDAVFLAPEQRKFIEQAAMDAGAEFTGVWLEAREDQLLERVKKRENDASDADIVIVARQLETKPGPMSWHTISADGTRDDTERHVKQYLNLTAQDLKRLS